MYKDRSTVVPDVTKIDQKKFEFVNLYELIENTIQKKGEEEKENVNSQVDQSAPIAKVLDPPGSLDLHSVIHPL